ncbi:MAG TPA: PQQ-binding-like beta-propeller repeat protein, partial [Lacipirellula sp.]
WTKESLNLPRGVFPSGTGFVSDGKYHLPLTTAEVITIDLADGKIVSRASSRDGAPLGNLICHRGAVISQNGMHLDCFDQIDDLRRRSEERLAEAPNDVEALRTLGEIAYNEGRLSDAVSLLERAFRADSHDVEVRDVLAECLATALDEDFVAHRSKLPLLKELNDGGVARRMLILRIEAQGLLEEGEILASAAACLDLYRLAGAPDEMLDLGRDHEAAVSRWIQAQLAAIWEKASDHQRDELKLKLNREATGLGEDPSAEDMARFLQFFGNLPMFEPMRAQYAKLAGDPLEVQQILLDLADSKDADLRNESMVRLAKQLHTAGLASLAAGYDRRLKTEDADGELAELLEDAKQKAPKPLRQWPRGKVNVATAPTTGAAANARVRAPLWGVRLERTDSILGLAAVHISASRGGELVLHDNFGREFFSANLEPDNHINYRHPGTMYGVSRGNLLVLSLGRQIVAVNTLAAHDGIDPQVMWRASVGGNLHVEYARGFYGDVGPESQTNRPGTNRAPRPMDEGKWVGVIGPVTSQGVVFQDQRQLMCVDALSGDLRWSRSDVPQGCDLFGDDQYVFAAPTGSTTARVYSAVDGRFIGKRQVPEWQQQLVTRGRTILVWKKSGDSAELSVFDALTGDAAWKHEFESGSAVDVELGRYVAVVEPSGRVVIVDGASGEKLIDYAASAKPAIEEVHLAVGQDDFLVTVKRPRPGNVDRQVRPLANIYDSPVIDGELYLFDRTSGEMRWNRPAEVVQQALLLTQPVDVPFIVFAGQLARHDRGGSRAMTTMLILDKATGRTLFQSDDLPQTGGGHCVARVTDAANHQAAVEMAGQTILLQFTEERRPPEPPALAEVESSVGKSSEGLMGIFRNLGVGR